jgi:hypothetical protein
MAGAGSAWLGMEDAHQMGTVADEASLLKPAASVDKRDKHPGCYQLEVWKPDRRCQMTDGRDSNQDIEDGGLGIGRVQVCWNKDNTRHSGCITTPKY